MKKEKKDSKSPFKGAGGSPKKEAFSPSVGGDTWSVSGHSKDKQTGKSGK